MWPSTAHSIRATNRESGLAFAQPHSVRLLPGTSDAYSAPAAVPRNASTSTDFGSTVRRCDFLDHMNLTGPASRVATAFLTVCVLMLLFLRVNGDKLVGDRRLPDVLADGVDVAAGDDLAGMRGHDPVAAAE